MKILSSLIPSIAGVGVGLGIVMSAWDIYQVKALRTVTLFYNLK